MLRKKTGEKGKVQIISWESKNHIRPAQEFPKVYLKLKYRQHLHF